MNERFDGQPRALLVKQSAAGLRIEIAGVRSAGELLDHADIFAMGRVHELVRRRRKPRLAVLAAANFLSRSKRFVAAALWAALLVAEFTLTLRTAKWLQS